MTTQPAVHAAADRLLARAIRLALQPGWTVEASAADLAALGAGPLVVRTALGRAYRALEHRESEIARRVAETLHAVHESVDRPLVPA